MGLLQEIYDRLLFEQLIAEGKDPREVLHYKYQDVPSDIIDAIIEIDPTKKKTYSQWLLNKWDDESDVITNNLRNGRIAKLFQHFKAHQDIQIKDFPSVGEVLRDFVPEVDTVLTKSDAPMTYLINTEEEVPSELANDFDIVFDEDNWLIAVPHTYEASCKLGENMKWCTANAYGNGIYHYKEYLTKGGKLYVNFDMSQGESRHGKDYPYTRYQFHFESGQFKDKENESVNVSEIGIPDSAVQFYESEGYDASDFEDDEARWERYIEFRSNYTYELNDELYLCIEWDDNYEAVDVDEYTKFYVFDHNDERDPITYDSVPNPFHYDTVFDDTMRESVILNTESEKYKMLIFKSGVGGRGGREWGMADIYNIIDVESGYFCISDFDGVEYYTLIESGEGYVNAGIEVLNTVDTLFENEYCGDESFEEDVCFIESVGEGFHTLISIIGYDMEIVVKNDIPVNGEYFEIDENGIIEGRYHRYRLPESTGYDYGDENYIQWQFERELSNGDYYVYCDDSGALRSFGVGDGKNKFNILSKETKEPIFEKCFHDIVETFDGIYLITLLDKGYSRKYGFFTFDGRQIINEGIGGWFNNCQVFSVEKCIVGVIDGNDAFNVYNVYENKVIGQFRGFVGKLRNTSRVLTKGSDGRINVFDYENGELYYEDLTFIKSLDWMHIWYATTPQEGGVIIDLENDRYVSKGISEIKNTGKTSLFKLRKMNGKENIYHSGKVAELLPYDVGLVENIFTDIGVILFSENNGRHYLYGYETKSLLLNRNGFPANIDIDYVNNGHMQFTNGEYEMRFNFNGLIKLDYWRDINDESYGVNLDPQSTPPEVLAMYSEVTGTQASVTEQFRRMTDRINKASRLYIMDLID